MRNSSHKMGFITDCISAYEQKIKLANINGLFDNAKLFEVFATEVCKLWFNQEFTNLNSVDKSNYHYVDLISDDKKLFVQVTTSNDLPKKIRYTLEKIRDTDDKIFSSVSNLIFFVLSNDSVSKLKDFTGENRIGDIEFTIKNNLITTDKIIKKAISDFDFQEKLYCLLKRDFESFKNNSDCLYKALKLSQFNIDNIDSKINKEYEINRQNLINRIIEGNEQYISIQGEPGSGKSVLCKKLVEGQKRVIYARAERFLEEKSVDKIWGFDLEKTLKYLGREKIVFFIDALEFIADSSKTKLELLDYFYSICSKHNNVKVITSCRTVDSSAFININLKYSIKTYECPLLTKEEVADISSKYPIIKSIEKLDRYSPLLLYPFYIDLVVSKISDIENIKDVNNFRKYIWTEIICLKTKSKDYRLSYNDIVDTVNYIVMERAKKFLLGVNNEKIKSNILDALKSEGIVVETGGTVRLKYDIFEDICFENYFDIEFDKSRGCFNSFFDNIKILGHCAYRRYQIWISNKIFTKSNREKFLYSILFSKEIPKNWRIQSEIGLVKSNYSQSFFDEYIDCIIENNLLFEFIQTINLYAFNIKSINRENYTTELLLEPCGIGRGKIIYYFWQKRQYQNNSLKQYIIRICKDFSNQGQANIEDKKCACSILEYYIDELWKYNEKTVNNVGQEICEMLLPIYKMSDTAKVWIEHFFIKLTKEAKSMKGTFSTTCNDIIKFTLKNAPVQLVRNLTENLCELAELYWTYSTKDKIPFKFYYDKNHDNYYMYGLNNNSRNYGTWHYNSVYDCTFLPLLFRTRIWDGLKWSIKFLNILMLNYSQRHSNDTVEIWFAGNDTKKTYIGSEIHWLAGVEESSLPTVIADIAYLIKEELINYGKYLLKNNGDLFTKFFLTIKDYIFKNSNNVILLSIISSIGLYFEKELPGYSLDLATSIDIVFWDLTRYARLLDNPLTKELKQQILLVAGLPYLKCRYNHQINKGKTLRTYVFCSQLYGNEQVTERCFRILDFLYSIIPNNAEFAAHHLQVQNMDSRLAKVKQINKSVSCSEISLSGEAAEIVKNNEKRNKQYQTVEEFIIKNMEKMKFQNFTIEDTYNMINIIEKFIHENKVYTYLEKDMVIAVIYALKVLDLSVEQRSELCNIWINGINKLFEGGAFRFNYSAIMILFEQYELGVTLEVKNSIKLVCLKLLTANKQNGIIYELSKYAQRYLKTNMKLANLIFCTIIKLSEKNQIICYDEMVKKYLFNEESLDIYSLDMSNIDVETMCYIANCGLDLNNSDFFFVIKKQLIRMISYWSLGDHWRHLSVYSVNEMRTLFEKEIIQNSSIALKCLFDDIDFSKFNNESVEFYRDIFGGLLVEFFDSHSDKERRKNCKKSIEMLEVRVNDINTDWVKKEFYKSICLSPTRHQIMHDWSQCSVGYSYIDKIFINKLLCKYGKYNAECTLYTIYQLQAKYLMPEILISLKSCLEAAQDARNNSILKLVNDEFNKFIIEYIIVTAFLDFNDQIKNDAELCASYERILEILASVKCVKAAVLLDEFHIH